MSKIRGWSYYKVYPEWDMDFIHFVHTLSCYGLCCGKHYKHWKKKQKNRIIPRQQ